MGKPTERKGLARVIPRALFATSILLGISACELWVGREVPGLPSDRAWQVLPMRAFLTRPGLEVEAMEFCRVDRCGYDAVVARLSATSEEAARLRASLQSPPKLASLIGGGTSRSASLALSVEKASFGGWTGDRIAMAKGARRAAGLVLERPQARDGVEVLLVIAQDDAVATALARDATR
jgi:hypothetical protein